MSQARETTRPIDQVRLSDLLLRLNIDGLTLLLVEHDLGEVLRIAKRLLVLDAGRLLAQGDPREVMARPDARRSEERVFAMFPRLAERRRQRAGLMSGGEQQMLAIGRALMAEPKMLLIDELSLGLMPAVVDHIFDTLETLRREGMTVLLVEQNIQRALLAVDDVVVMTAGTIAYQGTSAQAASNDHLAELFLG